MAYGLFRQILASDADQPMPETDLRLTKQRKKRAYPVSSCVACSQLNQLSSLSWQ